MDWAALDLNVITIFHSLLSFSYLNPMRKHWWRKSSQNPLCGQLLANNINYLPDNPMAKHWLHIGVLWDQKILSWHPWSLKTRIRRISDLIETDLAIELSRCWSTKCKQRLIFKMKLRAAPLPNDQQQRTQ